MPTITTTKVAPTREQVETFDHAIEMFKDADVHLVAGMDEDGTMLLSMTEDELAVHARFSPAGVLMGDWF